MQAGAALLEAVASVKMGSTPVVQTRTPRRSGARPHATDELTSGKAFPMYDHAHRRYTDEVPAKRAPDRPDHVRLPPCSIPMKTTHDSDATDAPSPTSPERTPIHP